MSSSILDKMDNTLAIVELLQANLTSPHERTQLFICPWRDPASLQEEYLKNNLVQFLVTVKKKDTQHNTRRMYNYRCVGENSTFLIEVWTFDSPHYNKYPIRGLVEKLTSQIKQVFNANPFFGTVVSVHNADHQRGTLSILNDTLTIIQYN